MFKPEYAVLAAFGVCVMLGLLLMSNQAVKADGLADAPAAALIQEVSNKTSASQSTGGQQTARMAAAAPAQAALGKATLDLVQLAKTNTIDEVDNARWALLRDFQSGQDLYSDAAGVNWKELRKLTQAGIIHLPAGSTWSFNEAYQEGVGYKNASGVLAGGQCALATVLRVAADRAGLVTSARQHRYPVPGFDLAETVNIWWGRDDLTVRNPTKQNLSLTWLLTPETLTVTVIPTPASK